RAVYGVVFTVLALFSFLSLFFFHDTATTELYTLSLHDALPICLPSGTEMARARIGAHPAEMVLSNRKIPDEQRTWKYRLYFQVRSEEHTSELQSLAYLVCRLLLEKKKKKNKAKINYIALT